ncbi:MAG: hypothetical protein V4469_05035 [Patescibacteria group bacterium]
MEYEETLKILESNFREPENVQSIQKEIGHLERLQNAAASDFEDERIIYEGMSELDDGDIKKITQLGLVEEMGENLLRINEALNAKKYQLTLLKDDEIK